MAKKYHYTHKLGDANHGRDHYVIADRVEFTSSHVLFLDVLGQLELAVHADDIREVWLDH